jgi:diketogulonate reductase-like aldo/keto reductase
MENQTAATKGADIPVYELSSGYSIPRIGLGTDGITDPSIISRAITEIGYRVLDTASRYKNEQAVGAAVKMVIEEGTIKREELFIITKVWIDEVEDV